MKRLMRLVFAIVIGMTLSMPAWSQADTAPTNQTRAAKKSAKAAKKEEDKEKKDAAKAKKKAAREAKKKDTKKK